MKRYKLNHANFKDILKEDHQSNNLLLNMKRTLLLTVFSILPMYSYCQFNVGIGGGINVCSQSQIIDYSSEPFLIKPGQRDIKMIAGIKMELPVCLEISNFFGIVAAPAYVQKGVRIISVNDYSGYQTPINYKTDATGKYDYFEMPLYGKIMFGSSDLKFNIFLGSSFGRILRSRSKSTITITEGEQVESIEIDTTFNMKALNDAGYNKFDVSLGFGLGAKYKLGYVSVYINAICHLGLLNLFNPDEFEFDMIMKNKGLGISFGYMIPINKRDHRR